MINLLNIGVRADASWSEKRKFRVTNFLILFYMVLATIFLIISFVLFPPLVIYPLLAILVGIHTFPLNYFGFIHISRLVVALIPNTLATLYHASLISAQEDLISSFYLFQLSLLVAPWLCIEMKERWLLFVSVSIHALLFFGIPILNPWLEMPVDSTYFRQGWLAQLIYFFAFGIIFGAFYYLGHTRYQQEIKTLQSMGELRNSHKALEESREKLRENVAELEKAHYEDSRRAWIVSGISQLEDFFGMAPPGGQLPPPAVLDYPLRGRCPGRVVSL